MAKKVASHRLDAELLDWLAGYARSRGASQGVVVEEALRSFRADAEGGVPDLPAEATPPKPRVPGVTTARSLLDRGVSREVSARQHRLNEAKARSAQGGES